MAYVAVKGGEEAILQAKNILEFYRVKGDSLPIDVKQIEEQMSYAVDKVMSEGSLYNKELSALAIKQAQGDILEASFYVRALRSTMPRITYSEPINTKEMRIKRRISDTFKDIPGGQYLGATRDYENRILNVELLEEDEKKNRDFRDSFISELETVDEIPEFTKISNIFRKENLLQEEVCENKLEEVIDDITRNSLRFPVSRSAKLQALTRGESGVVSGFAYAIVRGFGDEHPYISELRTGNVFIKVKHPIYEDEEIIIGDMLVTECEIVSKASQNKTENSKTNSEDKNKMSLGYGLCMGNNENKAISMAILDKSLEPNSEKLAQDEEFVLLHIDGIDSLGFISHFKLPHYVDFKADVERIK
ncbi:TPA: carbon-phosphorus lyase complex subunit PhnI [Clostridioides difficile]|nr:carbon-phosphorus lyase complex subunit PhnI [Clostridioides difficile]